MKTDEVDNVLYHYQKYRGLLYTFLAMTVSATICLMYGFAKYLMGKFGLWSMVISILGVILAAMAIMAFRSMMIHQDNMLIAYGKLR